MKADLTKRVHLPILLMLGVAGCTTGRTVPPPSLADLGLADRYGSVAAGAPAAALPSAELARWWRSFGDPVLDMLIERGRSENLDVQGALLADDRRDVGQRRNVVQAEIASTYVRLRMRQAMVEDMRGFLKQRDGLVRLIQYRTQAGLVPPLDTARAVAGRAEVAARLPDLQARTLQDSGRIAAQTAQPPDALNDLLAGAAPIPAGPADVPLGRPSDLGVRQTAVRDSAARLAKRGKGSARRQAEQIAYKQAILGAVQAVETQNIAWQSGGQREAALRRALALAEAAARLARRAYADGLADYSALEAVEDRLLATGIALRQAQAERALALISLYVALGTKTGWDDPVPDTPIPVRIPGG